MRVICCLLLLFLLLGCATTGSGSSAEAKPSGTADSADQSPEMTSPVAPLPLEGPDRLLASTLPGYDRFELAGLSPGYYDPEEEISHALDHAARQLAVYYGAVVVSQEYLAEQTGLTRRIRKIEIRYDEQLAGRLKKSLVPGLSLRGKDYFVGRISYVSPDAPDIPVSALPSDSSGQPLWVGQPPRIDGYVTAVGSAQSRRNLAESWEQADKEGMAGIAESLGAQIRSREATLSKEGGGAIKAESYTLSSEKIKGMYVIARWRDPDHRTYYSLVVKKKD